MKLTLAHSPNFTPAKFFVAMVFAAVAVLMSACGTDIPVAGINPPSGTNYQLASADEPPMSGQRDVPLSFFTVELRDTEGNVVASYDGMEVSVSLQGGAGTLSGQLSQVLENGMAIFDDLQIDGSGEFVLVVSAADPIHGSLTLHLDITEPPSDETPLIPSGFRGGTVAGTSMDNRIVAFDYRDEEDPGMQLFAFDRVMETVEKVSAALDGGSGNGESIDPSLSSDGRFVAFESAASNLTDGDSNGFYDVFVRDRQLGKTTRVSTPAVGGQADGHSWAAGISSDGRYVEFSSTATNLVNAEVSGTNRYRYDRLNKTLELLTSSGGGR